MARVKKPRAALKRHFIKDWRLHRGLTQDQLSELIALSRTQIAKIESGHQGYNQEHLEAVANALNAKPWDLIFAPPSTNPRDEVVRETQRVPLGGEFAKSTMLMNLDQRVGVPAGHIPQVDTVVGMGDREEAQTVQIPIGDQAVSILPVLGTWDIPESVLRRRVRTSVKRLHFIECEGNSMVPLINDGDVVLIDETKVNPAMPGVFALWEGSAQTIKQVEMVHGSDPPKLRLIPANKVYAATERLAEEVVIIGRYVARFTVN